MDVSFDRGKAYKLFEKALDMDAPARAEFLAQTCAEQAVLRAEVESLLHIAERSYDTNQILACNSQPTEDLVGRDFGRFRLLERTRVHQHKLRHVHIGLFKCDVLPISM